MTRPCPICNQIYFKERLCPSGADRILCECRNCGNYVLPGSTEAVLADINLDEVQRAILAHAIWKMQNPIKPPELHTSLLKSIVAKEKVPVANEQAARIISWLGDVSKDPASLIGFPLITVAAKAGAVGLRGVHYVMKVLEGARLIEVWCGAQESLPRFVGEEDQVSCCLTFAGWQEYEKLKKGASESRKVFMALTFGGEHWSKVTQAYAAFQKAVSETGFSLSNPLLDTPKAGLIDDHLRVEIRLARFLIVDLTGNNNGCYWEAGFAEGLGKTVIYTCEESFFKGPKEDGKGTHFDTAHLQTVLWDLTKLDDAAKQMKDIIRNTFPSDAKMED